MARVAVVLAAVVIVILLAPALSFMELRALDCLFALRPARAPDPRVVIIDAGEDPAVYEALRDPHDSPTEGCQIPRRTYAEAVRRLSRWGAKVIVFDLMFSRHCPYEDDELAHAFRDAGNVIVAATTKTVPGAVSLQPPVAPLGQAAWAVGSPVAHQPNETLRSVPMVVRDRDSGLRYFALSLLAFQRLMGVQPMAARLSEGHWLLTADCRVPLRSGERTSLMPFGEVPASSSRDAVLRTGVEVVRGRNARLIPGLRTWNCLLINWAGPQGTIRPHALGDVLAIANDQQGRELFAGKAVIIGPTEWRMHWTPVGAMPGLEVQGNVLHTLLSRSFIRPLSPWAMLGALVAFSLVTACVVRRLRGLRAAGTTLVIMVAAAVLAGQLLVRRGLWMYVFYTDLAVGLTWALTTIAESDTMVALLGRFVPSIIGRPEAPRAGEVRTVDVSVLFSDLRGYTGTAERLTAVDILGLLSTYQAAVEDIVARHGGTIVKTPGDAVLAVFWERRKGDSHAACALRAGCEIVANLPDLARAWEAAGLKLDTGIGINAGPVAMGLIGTRHLEPTVIGDAVNVAQRLESLTATFGYPIIFSESVLAGLPEHEHFEAVRLGELTVRGRETPITVYGVARAGCASQPPETDVDHPQKETRV